MAVFADLNLTMFWLIVLVVLVVIELLTMGLTNLAVGVDSGHLTVQRRRKLSGCKNNTRYCIRIRRTSHTIHHHRAYSQFAIVG